MPFPWPHRVGSGLGRVTRLRHVEVADCIRPERCGLPVNQDPVERLKKLALEAAHVKAFVVIIVAAATGVLIGLGAALFGLSSSDAFLCGLMGCLGAVPSVLVFLR